MSYLKSALRKTNILVGMIIGFLFSTIILYAVDFNSFVGGTSISAIAVNNNFNALKNDFKVYHGFDYWVPTANTTSIQYTGLINTMKSSLAEVSFPFSFSLFVSTVDFEVTGNFLTADSSLEVFIGGASVATQVISGTATTSYSLIVNAFVGVGDSVGFGLTATADSDGGESITLSDIIVNYERQLL